jgi:large subunit ribosomal protein L24e
MKCSFCDEKIREGTGTIFARKSGKILFFCSMKCEKNTLKLGRKPVNYKWSKKGAEK